MERVRFHPLAERELNDAAERYESQSPGLGSRFLIEARRCTTAILEHPDSGFLLLER